MGKVMSFSPDYIVTPGVSITEMLEALSMTQKELAKRMNLTEKTVCEIIKGSSPITQKHAKSLEFILGLPSSFWLNLQRNYEDAKYEVQYIKELDQQVEIAEQFPQETLKQMGLLPKGRNHGKELVKKLLQIFKVQNLSQVSGLYDVRYNCRISNVSTVDEYALVTWMRLGELEADKKIDYKELPPFNLERVNHSMEKLRKINHETDASVFLEKLQKVCRDLGIIFVVVPEIKGSRISGMARWKSVGKRKIPMIQLSLRGKKHDIFWFTFFHELAHILLHDEKDEIFVDTFEKAKDVNMKEEEADTFSSNTLIPNTSFNDFIKNTPSSKPSQHNILEFSESIDIHPGIVVGRLQKEGYLEWSHFHNLKVTYKWSFEK